MNELTDTEKSKLCLQCGSSCCKLLHIPCNSSEEWRFYKTRGLKRTFDISTGRTFITIEQTCQYLDETEGKGCKIYKDRPISCVVYDGRKDPILKTVCLWDSENLERKEKRKEER